MIKFEHVSKAYARNKVYAVYDVSFSARAGEIFGFLGPNGAGKTTSIKMLSGILQPTSGTVTVCDCDVMKDPIGAKRHMGFVPDDQVLFEKLTGREYVNFISDVYGVTVEERNARLQTLLEKFNLAKDFDAQIAGYSHGMRQKITIIGALIHNPDVWILDEPMTGLDAQAAFELKQMMREHADQGKTVLFSTHVLEVAEKVCDRIGIINHGRMLAVGTIEEMHEALGLDLESAFLKIIETDNARTSGGAHAAGQESNAEASEDKSNLGASFSDVKARYADADSAAENRAPRSAPPEEVPEPEQKERDGGEDA